MPTLSGKKLKNIIKEMLLKMKKNSRNK